MMLTTIESWVLGYAVNALWQVPVVFGTAWMVAWLLRKLGAAGVGAEHRVWVGALLVEVVLPGCPVGVGVVVRRVPGMLLAWWRGSADGGGVNVRLGAGGAVAGVGIVLPGWVLHGLAVAYGGSVVYFAARLGWGLWRTRGMRVRAEGLGSGMRGSLHSGFAWDREDEGEEWEKRRFPSGMTSKKGNGGEEGLCGWKERRFPSGMTSRKGDVRVSAEVEGPVTVGAWRGVVLVPVGFLERVGAEDLEAVLAHEGAHVRRRDFLKNALYGLASLPGAFHPAMWATRARVAESREMVCDAMAAEAVAGRERYAGSLLRLASLLIEARPARRLHAIGIFGMFDANSFERRVMHLTGNGVMGSGTRRTMTAVACVVLGVGTCATAAALRAGVPGFAQQAGSEGQAQAPARVPGAVMAGQVLSRVNPVYPPDAKAEKISGTVVLQAVIGKDGTVERIEVVSGPEKLRTSALDAVRQWVWKPYLLNGEATEVETTVQVNYSFGGG